MSFGAPAPEDQQPGSFTFTAENLQRARTILARYPENRAASGIIPLLDLAQRQHDNWLPRAAMDAVADMVGVAPVRVYEVASFYTMFNKAPVGKNFVQVCTTTPCWLRGSDDVLRAIKDKTGCAAGQASEDGIFTVIEVECLGACVNAPMVQVNDDYYEDLDYARTCTLMDALAAGKRPEAGSRLGRQYSQAASGPTTMLDQAPAAAEAEKS